ncbi:MAG TPA: metallophosphoesterase [Candidatus Limnocylindrales bacterium]|nr:metallophosphoesterase [Candidatus Limnocylindrales bacterium]
MSNIEQDSSQGKDRFRRTRRAGRRLFKGVAAVGMGSLAVLAPDAVEHTSKPQGIVWESETVLGTHGVTVETPLGDIILPTHSGPFGQNVRVRSIPVEKTLNTLQEGEGVSSFAESFGNNLKTIKKEIQKDLARDLVIFALGGSVGWVSAEAITRKEKTSGKEKAHMVMRGVLAGAVLAGSVSAYSASTYDSKSVEKAKYTGGIAYAKEQLGLLEKFDEHDDLIALTVRNYLRLSNALQKQNNTTEDPSTCIMVVSDIHSRNVAPLLRSIISTSCVDAVVDAGDLTEWGASFENEPLADLGNLGVNYYVVRGNHDSEQTMTALSNIPNVTVLDGQMVEVKGIKITGVADKDYSPDDQLFGQSDRVKTDLETGQKLKKIVDQEIPDLVVVHKPDAAKEVVNNTRIVISGHSHRCMSEHVKLDSGTINFNVGTTGGANLRTMNDKCTQASGGDTGQPQTFSILYFDAKNRPASVDRFVLSGLQPNGKLDLQVTRTPINCSGECDSPGQKRNPVNKVTTTTAD